MQCFGAKTDPQHANELVSDENGASHFLRHFALIELNLPQTGFPCSIDHGVVDGRKERNLIIRPANNNKAAGIDQKGAQNIVPRQQFLKEDFQRGSVICQEVRRGNFFGQT